MPMRRYKCFKLPDKKSFTKIWEQWNDIAIKLLKQVINPADTVKNTDSFLLII